MPARAKRIRELNDALRSTLLGGQVVITQGVRALGADAALTAMASMRAFSAFDRANDPHGEHDCAIFASGGARFLFKIDYYDRNMEGHSANPSDPDQTLRVLTLMLASEY